MKHLFIILLILSNFLGYSQDIQWIKQIGDKGNWTNDNGLDYLSSILTNDIGDTYLAGGGRGVMSFDNGITFNGIFNNQAFNYYTYLIKYNKNGDFVWVKNFIDFNNLAMSSLSKDPLGNIYMVGTGFKSGGAVQYIPQIIIIKVSPNGEILWQEISKTGGQDDRITLFSTNTDSFGNLYITGRATGTVLLGDIKINAGTTSKEYIAKYNTEGKCLWVELIGTPPEETYPKNIFSLIHNNDHRRGVISVVDTKNNINTFSAIAKTTNFGNNNIVEIQNGLVTPCFTKHNSDGSSLLVKVLPLNNTNFAPEDTKTDLDGNFYLLHRNLTNGDAFFTKISYEGNIIWNKKLPFWQPPNLFYQRYKLAVDGKGNVFITGRFLANATFSNRVSINSSDGMDNYFIAKYNPKGEAIWARTLNATRTQFADIALDRLNNIYLSGRFQTLKEPTSFDLYAFLWESSNRDIFLTKLLDCPKEVPIESKYSVVCGKDTLLRTIDSQEFTYQWQQNKTDIKGATDFFYNPTESGLYRVILRKQGCNTLTSTEILIEKGAEAEILGNKERKICGGSTSLIAKKIQDASYIWLKDGKEINQANTETFIATQDGEYQVKIKFRGCESVSEAVKITLNLFPTPTITEGNQISFCEKGVINAEPTAGASYAWFFDGRLIDKESRVFLNVSQSGYYTLQITKDSCTILSKPIQVTIKPLPLAKIDTAQTYFCFEGILKAANVEGAVYTWTKDGQRIGTNAFALTIDKSGSYVVSVNKDGCVATSSPLKVIVKEHFNARILQINGITYCKQGLLEAQTLPNASYSYQWFKNEKALIGENNATIMVKETAHYYVAVTQDKCTIFSNKIAVNINQSSGLQIAEGKEVSFCRSGKLNAKVANSNDVFTFEWRSDNKKIDSLLSISVTKSGTYSIIAKSKEGCADTVSIKVNIFSLPEEIDLQSSENPFCKGNEVLLTATPIQNAIYHWFNGTNLIASTAINQLKTTQEGNLSVKVALAEICEQKSKEIQLRHFVNPIFDLKLIESQLKSEVAIYPNPASDFLYFNFLEGKAQLLLSENTNIKFFSWLFNGQKIRGRDNQQAIEPEQDGKYAFEAQSKENCYFISPTLSFKRKAVEKTNITIYDILGRVIFVQYFTNFSISIPLQLSLANFPTGILLVRVDTGNEVVTKKIICIKQ